MLSKRRPGHVFWKSYKHSIYVLCPGGIHLLRNLYLSISTKITRKKIIGNLSTFCWIYTTAAIQKNHLNTLLLIPKQQKSNISNLLGLCGIPQRGLHNIFENLKLCVVFLFLSLHKPMLMSMRLYELKGFENIVYHLFQWSD